jgi:hypothetical protein
MRTTWTYNSRMDDALPRPPEPPDLQGGSRQSRRFKQSLVLTGLGLVAILWGVLHLTSASLGGPPKVNEFANRRTYNQIKREVHLAYPGLLWRCAIGGLLIFAGARMRAR